MIFFNDIYPTLRLRKTIRKHCPQGLIITENGYASVMFAGSLHYINSNGDIILLIIRRLKSTIFQQENLRAT